MAANAGLLIPVILFKPKIDIAIKAPLLPPETIASELPSETELIACPILVSLDLLIAIDAFSSFLTQSSV